MCFGILSRRLHEGTRLSSIPLLARILRSRHEAATLKVDWGVFANVRQVTVA